MRNALRNEDEMKYKLLTPGPLTTTDTVKQEMMIDHCTWDNDYKAITQTIRRELLKLAQVSDKEYTAVLMQGSGSFGVESAITTLVNREDDHLLILANGSYGERMADIAHHARIPYQMKKWPINERPDAATVRQLLQEHGEITHVAMVHSETTSGILNDVREIGQVVKEFGATFIVDAMSSFAGVEIPVKEWGIDCVISSANKCIQGVPGFSFIIVRKNLLEQCEGNARSLALDLYDQWKTMDVDGKWRFTSPTHVVLAFAKALEELAKEGGVAKRHERYAENEALLWERMTELGFVPFLDQKVQGPIITTFYYPPECNFDFQEMYDYVKAHGYILYPGKTTDAETFRVGNIGEIYKEDIEKLALILRQFIESRQEKGKA